MMTINDDTPNSDETDSPAVNETSAILIPSVGDLDVIKYPFNKKKFFSYLGLIQERVGEKFQVQFLKKAGENTFTVKECDVDLSIWKRKLSLMVIFPWITDNSKY